MISNGVLFNLFYFLMVCFFLPNTDFIFVGKQGGKWSTGYKRVRKVTRKLAFGFSKNKYSDLAGNLSLVVPYYC